MLFHADKNKIEIETKKKVPLKTFNRKLEETRKTFDCVKNFNKNTQPYFFFIKVYIWISRLELS